MAGWIWGGEIAYRYIMTLVRPWTWTWTWTMDHGHGPWTMDMDHDPSQTLSMDDLPCKCVNFANVSKRKIGFFLKEEKPKTFCNMWTFFI